MPAGAGETASSLVVSVVVKMSPELSDYQLFIVKVLIPPCVSHSRRLVEGGGVVLPSPICGVSHCPPLCLFGMG